MHEFAITVIGHDRPGIIADAAEALAALGLNLTDSSMTRLRGHFAMTLVCVGEPEVAQVEEGLRGGALNGSLVVSVRELSPELEMAAGGGHYVVTLHGADRLGIVASIARLLAEVGGNVTDLTTRLTGGLYVLVAEVDVPSTVDIEALGLRLRSAASALGVEAQLRPAEADLL